MDKVLGNPWRPGVPIKNLPGNLPPDQIPHDVDLQHISSLARQAFENLSEEWLVEDALWYDMMTLTPHIRTHFSQPQILDLWKQQTAARRPRDFQVSSTPRVARLAQGTSWLSIGFTFRISDDNLVGNCSGTLAFVPAPRVSNGNSWKIWMLSTVLENYSGYGHPDIPLKAPKQTFPRQGIDYAVIIVGGGQCGLSLGGRLQALGISYIVLERSAIPGYRWISRYDSVRQHTIREVNNLPFGHTWDPSDSDFLPGPTVARGFSDWVKKYNINIWTSAEVISARFDESHGCWTVTLTRDNQHLTLHSLHLAIALGAGLTNPRRPPPYPNEHLFTGTLMHTVSFKNSARWRGLRGLVVGSGTAAHDIAQDMHDHALSSVTMLQRDKTALYPLPWYIAGQHAMYKHDKPIEPADRLVYAMPIKIGTEVQRRSYERWMRTHPEYFDEVEHAGFGLDRTSTPNEIVLNHFGGYYIDVGTTKHIVDGDIRIRSGVTIERFTPNSREIVLSDGSKIEADLVVLATGYEPDYRKDVVPILGEEIAGKLGPFWGLDENGDIRGFMKEQKGEGVPPGLWLLAGAASHARFYSRFMALMVLRSLLSAGRGGGEWRGSMNL
ncbi:uncharacterized protein Z518_08668 [Rhinocladiella mackenziei CBS 650.93]|uniref:FAD/NAD(P)-binding domain-containing protein n=1 Tax=Rhinocladiella mackenziei CBS 650.93 TaxID=1442369 RepID=A0A0D2IHE3_9EURO|nr:uncharacterized protein Z518_08668 [Rhinocladiella mackenziei CBS 650.93]KIX02726.1 hypothetical protein Z518_08668 [Rhinocladiella mackenziei CBS 650.93]